MKFKEITVERNFRISNDDPYLKERITATVQLDDTDNEQMAMNMARQQLIKNFKLAYPNVYTYLNFDEVNSNGTIPNQHYIDAHGKSNQEFIETVLHEDGNFSSTLKDKEYIPPKQTLEEQIQSCTSIDGDDGLYSWLTIAKSNKKLMEVYNKKLEELQRKDEFWQKAYKEAVNSQIGLQNSQFANQK